MTRVLKINLLIAFMFVSGSLSSCTSNLRKDLVRQTGIAPCKASTVKLLDSEQDVSRFELLAKFSECKPAFTESIIQASQGGCRGLIDVQSSCSYSFNNKTVIAEKMPSAGDVNRYEVRSW